MGIGIGMVGLLVLGTEIWRTRAPWPGDRDLLTVFLLSSLGLLLCGWGVPVPVRVGLGLGWALGLALVGLAPFGRAAQGLGVMVAAAGWLLPGDPALVIPFLGGVGVGMGGIGIPVLLRWRWPGLGAALTLGWLGIAGMVWGSRLLALGDGEERWLLDGIPLIMALVVGMGSLLEWWQGQGRWQVGVARVLGAGLTGVLGLIVERNLLGHSGSLTLWMAVGMILAVVVSTWDPGEASDYLWRAALTLVVAGGAALLALRLGGSHGAAVMGLGCLLVPGAEALALFLGVRPLVQTLIYGYGLTNISLTHSYTNAGLFLGLVGVALGGILWGSRQQWWIGSALTVATLGSVLGIGYFFHTQPQAAWLLGSLMAAFVLAVLAPLLPLPWRGWGVMALMLVGWGTLVALITPELLQSGIDATRWERLRVLAGVVVVGGIGGGILVGVQRLRMVVTPAR